MACFSLVSLVMTHLALCSRRLLSEWRSVVVVVVAVVFVFVVVVVLKTL